MAFKDKLPEQRAQVDTYVNNRSCQWAYHNIELIDPRGYKVEKKE